MVDYFSTVTSGFGNVVKVAIIFIVCVVLTYVVFRFVSWLHDLVFHDRIPG